ncbi:extracellular solute-binding protein (plasmid) [Agrobacterium tumefaciens]|uniref:Extracellular solute-binding protein n=1 Tax=Agrobacterium tumefaciens TaxID=358 RepID=A0AAJ4N9R6_AGRTU|nr:extracellular solute-binding protein [Agrobacterium tumefaciens]
MSKNEDNKLEKGISRRTFNLAGLGSMAALVAMRAGPSWAAGEKITYYGYGGQSKKAMHELVFTPFSQTTGIEVVEGTFGDETEIITRLKSGGAGDLNVFSNAGFDMYKRYVDLEANSELNEENIPNLKLVSPVLIDQLRKLTPNGKLSAIPYLYGTTGIAYNTKHVSREEAKKLGYKLLWDKRFAGKLALSNYALDRIWSAALYTGQDPNNLSNTDAIFAALREQRPLVKKYWESGSEVMDLLAKEEVIVAETWSTRAAALKKDNYPIEYLEPEQCQAWIQNLFVLKGSPMEPCEKLLDLMLKPEVNFDYCLRTNSGSSLDPRKTAFPEQLKNQPGFDPSGTFAGFNIPDGTYWASKIDQLEPQWRRVAKGA